MALSSYGVLIGTLNRYERESPDSYGRYFHGFLYVDAPAGQYKCAVDVSTPSGVRVEHRELRGMDASLFAPIKALSNGWHLLASNSTSGAMDYVRSPILNKKRQGCLFVVYNAFLEYLNSLLRRWYDSGWILSTGQNALDAMESLFANVSKFQSEILRGLAFQDLFRCLCMQ
jgi:hypothetical protein